MAAQRRTQKELAANVIFTALGRNNRQDCHQLRAQLASRNIAARNLGLGIRYIRDMFGEHALIVDPEGRRRLYVLDPDAMEAKRYIHERACDALTRCEHNQDILDWLASQLGNTGYVRRSRRYSKNLVEELRELVEATSNGQ